MSKKLELYYFPSCPFCVMVLDLINELGLAVEFKNIHEDQSYHSKLVQDTGRQTVPCLYIDGKPMFESADIMKWLKENQTNLAKA